MTEDNKTLGEYIKSAGTEIAFGILLGAAALGVIRGCTDNHTITHKYVNPPAIETA